MADILKYRSEFPHLNNGHLYLDHAAVSPLNIRSKTAMEQYLNERSGARVNNYHDTLEKMNEVRDRFARILSASSDRLAIVQNTTDGFILLARGYPWKQGDRIVLHRKEFPSNVYPWYDLKPFGVEIDFINSDYGEVSPAQLEKVVTNKTVLVSVSWVQYLSGYRNNIKALSDWCHERGILLAVDAMQGLGSIEYNQNEWQADYISSGTAKWLIGVQGIGLVYISEALQSKIHPPHLGWHSRESFFDFHNYDQALKPYANRYEFATPASPGIWGTNEALGLLLEVGIQNIQDRIMSLTDVVTVGLQSIGFQILSNRAIDNIKSGIVVFTHPDRNKNEQIHTQLREQHVTISLRENILRVSPHFYNSEEEIDKFCTLISESF